MTWLISKALMNSLFLQGQVEEYLGDTSLDGEQSVQSSGSSTPQAYCAPDKMTGFSRLSRFGMMYAVLTETRGEELLTLYLADFHAKTSAQRGGGAGITGERSGMWKHMARIIGEVRPQHVFVENSPMLTSRGLGVVLADLSTLGFDAKWGVVSAVDVGANHQRERIWIRAEQRNFFSHAEHNGIRWRQQQSQGTQEKDVADTESCGSRRITGEFQAQNEQQTTKRQEKRVWQSDNASEMANANEYGTQSQSSDTGKSSKWIDSSGIGNRNWWAVEPNVGRVAHGIPNRVDRLARLGNAVVPQVAQVIGEMIMEFDKEMNN